MAQIDAFFQMMHETGASDLHLSSGAQPVIRLHGVLERVKYPALGADDLRKILYEITPERKIKQFEDTGDVDFAHEVPGLARYRVNYFMQQRGPAAAFREIPSRVSSLDELGLPALLKDLAMLPKGLVLVTGPTGSGKSTTLAAMIGHANASRRDHILTIEDPVEFVHEPAGCLINQREIGRDSVSFQKALRGALREDPDIILVGEMRDLETIELALEAAETGHLVLSTLHTMSAPKTVDRIIDAFPGERQAQIRAALSESLRAVISQTLLRRADRPGRVAALDILVATAAVRNLIRESKIHQIPGVMETGRKFGMRTLEDSLAELVQNGVVAAREAAAKALNPERLRPLLPPGSLPDPDGGK